MNEYEKGFKRYRRFIEGMAGWETVYCGVSYETFCAYVNLGNHVYTKYMVENDHTIIGKRIKRHKMI